MILNLKYISFSIIFLITGILLTACTKIEIPDNFVYKNYYVGDYRAAENKCLTFVQNKLISPEGGIISNYISPESNSVLSESEGLIMLYYIEKNNKTDYDKHLNFLVDNLLLNKGNISWKYSKTANGKFNLSSSSASIDDLRIIRSLIYAYTKWGEEKYQHYFNKITNGLIYYQTTGKILNNGYENYYNKKINQISLSYIDIYTIKLLVDKNNSLKEIYNKSLNIIKKGYISNDIPFYHQYYNFRNNYYSSSNTINILDNLLITLHLCELNQINNNTVNWLTDHLNSDGAIYAEYSMASQKPVNKIESTAIYALLARIYKITGDNDMYHQVIKKMLSFQIKDSKSEISGSFGNKESLSAHSFDNLQALLAF